MRAIQDTAILVDSPVPPRDAIARLDAAEPLLVVDDLHVTFTTPRGIVRAVDGISYRLHRGEIMAIVGESGCGKSAAALAIMRLLARPAGKTPKGRILFQGQDLLKLPESKMREIRGRDIAMIFQEPMSSLNPVLSVGLQIMEPLRTHLGMDKETAHARALELLQLVGITDAERRLDQYPHQLSGGMRQRPMIAMGLACNPKLIIADEPTTALDVTIQAQILELMRDLSRRLDIALVIITHNLGIVARYADHVGVMYAGQMVEQATAEELFARPRHPYTIGLLKSVPRLDRPRGGRLETIEGLPPDLLRPPAGCRFAARCTLRLPLCDTAPNLVPIDGAEHLARCHRAGEIAAGLTPPSRTSPAPRTIVAPGQADVLLRVDDLHTTFVSRPGIFAEPMVVRAVSGVSFSVRRGETLGLVGESGCGKTTVGRTILRLTPATSGNVQFGDTDVLGAEGASLTAIRRQMQVIFQDPVSSLNPRMTVGQIIGEPLKVYRLARSRSAAQDRVSELLSRVGLHGYMAERYPHQLSGGQRQRVGIARALAMEPSFIVCDEPVSALDVSIQAQVITLLEELQRELGLAYLFIAHDLAVVRHISHRVAVMYLGHVVEMADRNALYETPLHPYTKALLAAAPVPDPAVERMRGTVVLGGEIPSPSRPPSGCVFHTRCPIATAECRDVVPSLEDYGSGHLAACIKLPESLAKSHESRPA